MIPFLRPTLPKLSVLQKKMEDVFRTGQLTNAKYVAEFEKRCADFLGVGNTIAVTNGTSALILALACLDLKKGKEIILSSFTFTSSGHAILWCGLKPVFADINSETFNIDPASIEEKITKNTVAILPVHVFGSPCEIDKIQEIARKYKLKVIYDGAHAFGAEYKGESVAKFGDACIFSFTPTKVITTGEGGMITTVNKEFAAKLKSGRNNGDNINRQEEFLGTTARMPEFCAILGLETLKIFPKYQKRRIKLVKFYKKELAEIPGISFQKVNPGAVSVYKDMAILVDKEKAGFSRGDLLKEFAEKKIEAKVYFYPVLHKKAVYKKYAEESLPNTDFVGDNILDLLLYSHMPFSYAKEVCAVVKNLHKKAGK